MAPGYFAGAGGNLYAAVPDVPDNILQALSDAVQCIQQMAQFVFAANLQLGGEVAFG